MGVRMLWPYLRSTLARTIRLRAEVPSQPLVVDLLSGTGRYLARDYTWDFAEMKRRVRVDVDALRRAGFKLIVFADAAYPPRPSLPWLQRRIKDLQMLYEFNSTLQSKEPERIWFSTQGWRPPVNVTHYLAQAFRDAGCPVYFAQESVDHEGAGLCIRHAAFGILSVDTDFMIYPGIHRFLNNSTFRLDSNGDAYVDGIDRSLFVRYLGISEEKLPMIVGFLGSDTFRGLQDQDKKYLEYKWKLEWLPEAVAREISTTSYNLMPSESLEALDHYKMIEPKPLPEMEEPLQSHYWISLREKQVLCQGVAWDSLAEKPCYTVLEPLRRAVYARCGLERVTEYLCHHQVPPDQWLSGSIVEMEADDAKAPEPSGNVIEDIVLACNYLQTAGELDSIHRQALLSQAYHRSMLLDRVTEFPSLPIMKDLHVASLFLQTIDFLYLGSAREQPPCWELFNGPLYHYLCQNLQELESLPPVFAENSFDWHVIVKLPRLTQTSSEQHPIVDPIDRCAMTLNVQTKKE